ncbi:hypothetical protein [Tenacibaculum finnmarkense]|uniref:hypothetical protein n=1 Tax=Tenacibaculum finnmarkense TaxID=2781243 RepID=UPI00187B8331|nr:hypothetical protein [Tenacibaculum finnmarkense]MBE7649162.1 hypothetical protein [Tenacibaculum finnmarkense genomovar ulcerans]
MHKIQIGTEIIRDYPSEISEMTPEQFTAFAGLVFLYQSKEISFVEFSKLLTYEMLNIKRRVDINNHPDDDKIIENILKISKLNNAFFDEKIHENKPVKVIKLDFVNNLIPKIPTTSGDLLGPKEALIDTQFGEYVIALNAYLDFSKTGQEADLNWLVASLYRKECKIRKKHHLEDVRTPFDKHKIAYTANLLKDVPFAYKYAVYLWFSACQNFIITNKQLELSGGTVVDLSVLFKKGESNNDKSIGMAGVIYSLAETGVFGDDEETAKRPTYDILLRMLQTYWEAKKMIKDAEN